MWSELWPAIDGVVCLSFFLEGETTTSNNFAKWRRHKTHVSDTFEVGKLYFKIDSYLPDFRESVISPYISLYTQAVAYTTYVESAAEGLSKTHQKDDF